jgi:hypothetical protein
MCNKLCAAAVDEMGAGVVLWHEVVKKIIPMKKPKMSNLLLEVIYNIINILQISCKGMQHSVQNCVR